MSNDDFDSKEYRAAYVDALIRNGLAFQIRALRAREDWTQSELADRIRTKQNVISRYEDPDYGSFALRTLKRLATEFNVALICRFATFGELRRYADSVSNESIAVLNYDQEMARAVQAVADNTVSRKIITFPSPKQRITQVEPVATMTDNTASQWWVADGALLAAEIETGDRVAPRKVTSVSSSSSEEFCRANA